MDKMKTILAIDPGTAESGFIIWDGTVRRAAVLSNEELLRQLPDLCGSTPVCAIEMVASYGMAVGKEVFETCVWIGRFMQACPVPVVRVFRKDIKMHLCQSARARDGNIRQALIDKHGPPGTKKAPGKLYGVSGHIWAALALADYVAETT